MLQNHEGFRCNFHQFQLAEVQVSLSDLGIGSSARAEVPFVAACLWPVLFGGLHP